MKILEKYKKIVRNLKQTSNWNSVPYLQGVIIGFNETIENLEKENRRLKNNEEVMNKWLTSKINH